jgi:large conductance mechanosensitive channel
MIAFVIFMVIRFMAKLRKQEETPAQSSDASPIPEDVLLLREIRDALKK